MRSAIAVLDELERHYETRIVDDGGGYTDNMSEFGPGAVKVITADRAEAKAEGRAEAVEEIAAKVVAWADSEGELDHDPCPYALADALRSKFGASK